MSDTRFSRQSRLLKPTDFKPVFDKTEWRGSTPQLLILARAGETGQARLGFVIPKKQIKLAVQRNRVRRIVRESFRLNRHQLDALDFVIMARSGLAELDNQQIREMIDALWFRLKRPSYGKNGKSRRKSSRKH